MSGSAAAQVPRLAYRPDIDGIRAVAVALVVVFHFHLVSGTNSGFMGVDLFFVISGFLITSIVQPQLAVGSFSLGTFWLHRIRRLAPALIATTALTLLAGWLWLLPSDFQKLAQQTVAAQLYYANVFFWRNVNYFGLQAHDVYLLHTWSLAVEEQFYILFPLVLVAISKLWSNRVGTLLIMFALFSFGLNVAFVGSRPEATFYLMPTRAWELLAGALLALHVLRNGGRNQMAATVAGVAGALFLSLAITTYSERVAFPGVFALLPVAAGVLLILSGSLGCSVTSRFLSTRVLVYFGKISYPLYLVHWPVNVFAASILGDRYTWSWRASMLLFSVALAAAVFHGVEGPVRRRLERLRPRAALEWYGAALAAALAVAVFVQVTAGAPARFPDRVVELAAFAKDVPPPLQECEYSGNAALRADAMCRLGSGGVVPSWFVYGDSHAWAASGAIDQWLKQTGQAARFMFVHACPPVRGVYVFRQGTACFNANAAALALLNERPELAQVLLVSTWRQAKEGLLTPAPDRQLGATESIALFDKQFAATLEDLGSMRKRIYVWEPLPGARVSVPHAMARSALDGAPLTIDFTRDEYLTEFGFFFDALRKHRQWVAGTFSPSREICGSGHCVSAVEGSPLYFDNAHLAYSSRLFWADALARQLPGKGIELQSIDRARSGGS